MGIETPKVELILASTPDDTIKARTTLRRSLKFIQKTCVRFLEWYHHTPVKLLAPSSIASIPPELYKPLQIANYLRQKGIIKKIVHKLRLPDEPFIHEYILICNEHTEGLGRDFFSEEKALWRAIGESVERHLWYNSDEFYKGKTITKSFTEVRGRSLDIFSLAGFTADQRVSNPSLHFTEDSTFAWVRAQSVTDNKKILCPLQLVSLHYDFQRENEPRLRWRVSTGLACGTSLEHALVGGIMEVIERDAFMITWLNKLSPPRYNISSLKQDPQLAHILNEYERYNLRVELVQLPTDFPVHVTLAIVLDDTGIGCAMSVGARAHQDLTTSIIDALREAQGSRKGHKKRMRMFSEKKLCPQTMDRIGRTHYWCDLQQRPKMQFLLDGAEIDHPNSEQAFQTTLQTPAETLVFLKNILREKKLATCYVELTDKVCKKIGLRVLQVVIPELQPMHLRERIPYFGGSRLQTVPEQLGYSPLSTLNTEPHPFP